MLAPLMDVCQVAEPIVGVIRLEVRSTGVFKHFDESAKSVHNALPLLSRLIGDRRLFSTVGGLHSAVPTSVRCRFCRAIECCNLDYPSQVILSRPSPSV